MRTLSLCLALGLVSAAAAEAPYEVKRGKAAVPEAVGEGLRGLLEEEAYQLTAEGKPALTIWLRQEIPVPMATARQLQRNKLDYRSAEHTEFMGVVKIDTTWNDFRNQKIEPGVYTLRLGFQPQDGDHMGTAPFNEFFLLVPAAKDTDPGLMDVRDLHEISAIPGGTHPGVMLLFPNYMPEEKPALVDQGDEIWTVNFTRPAGVDDMKGTLPFAIVVSGHSASE